MRAFLVASLSLVVLGTTLAAPMLKVSPEPSTKTVMRDTDQEEMYFWQGFYVLIHENGSRYTYPCSGHVYASSKSEAMQFAQADLQRQSSTTANIWQGSIGESGITRLSK